VPITAQGSDEGVMDNYSSGTVGCEQYVSGRRSNEMDGAIPREEEELASGGYNRRSSLSSSLNTQGS
jgi:hypothetical protein